MEADNTMLSTSDSSISSTECISRGSLVNEPTLKDFIDMETANPVVQRALNEFTHHLGSENVLEACKSLDIIESASIWEKLACFCVKSRLTDVALHCLAKMGNAAAVEVAHVASNEPEEDASLATIAIHLGLFEDAEKLYIESRRYDLLNVMYQACGQWDKALIVALKNDRVHLKNTHHSYAKYLEAMGHIKEAIKHYELSDTHRFEVPRMLFSLQQLDELQIYVIQKKDPDLHKWWAHYCEAIDLVPKAIDYYKLAGDVKSLVRVFCFLGETDAAAKVVSESKDASAAFLLACQLEKSGNVPEAINFFTMAGRYDYATQVAMKYGVDNELLSLSLQVICSMWSKEYTTLATP
ncbi:hypothetical protein O6H91_Y481300 [Diphasiastrum complanatum]|nr:hypothetical protein O6H91_Y481300 [Diphasiastrum complanatum]